MVNKACPTIHVKGKAGIIVINESDLNQYESDGYKKCKAPVEETQANEKVEVELPEDINTLGTTELRELAKGLGLKVGNVGREKLLISIQEAIDQTEE